MSDDLSPRVDALERLQAQQERLNDLLIDVTDRLGEEHALATVRLERHETHLRRLTDLAAQHAEQMAELRALLAAIKDMLDRGNGDSRSPHA